MRAVLFPGQGSQYVGMGADFYKKYDSVKQNFEIVDKTLGFSLSNIILNGPESELRLTQNTQPAIMLVGVSIFNILNKEFGFNLSRTDFIFLPIPFLSISASPFENPANFCDSSITCSW